MGGIRILPPVTGPQLKPYASLNFSKPLEDKGGQTVQALELLIKSRLPKMVLDPARALVRTDPLSPFREQFRIPRFGPSGNRQVATTPGRSHLLN
jgi:hypothetical protein